MKKALLLLGLPFVIASCNLSKPDFTFTNDTNKSYIYRNGDIKNVDAQSYSDFKRNSTAEDIKQTIDAGNQALIFLYNTTCSSCERFRPILTEVEKDTSLEINYINVKDSLSVVHNLMTYYPHGNYGTVLSTISTPSMYLLKSGLSIKEIEISSTKSATDLENDLFDLINATNIYTYHTYSGLLDNLKNEQLVFISNTENTQSNSFFDTSLNKKAKESLKNTAIINWQKLSQIDKDNYTTLFDLSSDFEVVLKCDEHGSVIEKYSYISETDQAVSFINSYY